jgi:hypothetical protein
MSVEHFLPLCICIPNPVDGPTYQCMSSPDFPLLLADSPRLLAASQSDCLLPMPAWISQDLRRFRTSSSSLIPNLLLVRNYASTKPPYHAGGPATRKTAHLPTAGLVCGTLTAAGYLDSISPYARGYHKYSWY